MAAFLRRSGRVEGVVLENGERALASAASAAGSVVATDRRLLVPTADGYHSIGWDRVDRAAWDGDAEVLVVAESAPLGSPRRDHRLRVEDPRRLLDVVREQVTASVVLTRHVPIDGSLGVRVTGRRRRDGITWLVAVDEGLRLEDPAIRRLVDAAVASVRAEVEP
ncbi:MAG: hypothetical protein ACRDVO_13440 [Jiangellaceae bacterium]|jgi:hypothetical protein|nr:hypothetical protein [Jiangellaceae bacterium]